MVLLLIEMRYLRIWLKKKKCLEAEPVEFSESVRHASSEAFHGKKNAHFFTVVNRIPGPKRCAFLP
jgi:hypothetical protein